MTQFIVLPLDVTDKLFPVSLKTNTRLRMSQKGHALEPIELESGTEFILPLEVLNDPAHAEALKMLAAQPYDTKVIDALPVDEKPQPILAKDAVDLKAAQLQREVLDTEFKKAAIDVAIDVPIDPTPLDVKI